MKNKSKYSFDNYFGNLIHTDTEKEKLKKKANNIRAKRFYDNNKVRLAEARKMDKENGIKRVRNSKAEMEKVRKWRKDNPDKVKALGKKYSDQLTDSYILRLLSNRNSGKFLSVKEAKTHPEEIEIKRAEILIERINRKIKTKTV
jgi:hypothetical protein